MSKILEIKDLTIHYVTDDEVVKAVNDISITLEEGESLGLVGETGAGKTTTAMGILGLVPNPPGKIIGGEVIYKGKNLLKLSEAEMRKIRGHEISMIFQDPMFHFHRVISGTVYLTASDNPFSFASRSAFSRSYLRRI